MASFRFLNKVNQNKRDATMNDEPHTSHVYAKPERASRDNDLGLSIEPVAKHPFGISTGGMEHTAAKSACLVFDFGFGLVVNNGRPSPEIGEKLDHAHIDVLYLLANNDGVLNVGASSG